MFNPNDPNTPLYFVYDSAGDLVGTLFKVSSRSTYLVFHKVNCVPHVFSCLSCAFSWLTINCYFCSPYPVEIVPFPVNSSSDVK